MSLYYEVMLFSLDACLDIVKLSHKVPESIEKSGIFSHKPWGNTK